MITNLKSLIESFITFTSVLILPLFIFDISIFNLFNLELGLFMTIIGNINLTAANFILLLIFIPMAFIVMFFIAVPFSMFLKCILFSMTQKYHNLNIYMVLIFFILFYPFALYLLTYILELISNNFDIPFTLFYLFLVGIAIALNTIYYLAYKLIKENYVAYFKQFIGACFIVFFIILSGFILFNSHESLNNIVKGGYLIFVLALSLHVITRPFVIDNNTTKNSENCVDDYCFITGSSVYDKKEPVNAVTCAGLNKPDKQNIYKYSFIFGIVILSMVYIDTFVNNRSWSKPIDSTKENGFSDLTLNLIFNRGILINNKNVLSFEVPPYYTEKVKKLKFFNKSENTIELGLKSKYLEIGSNLKMYFSNTHNSIYVFLVEEKKLSNSKGSEFNLIALSNYQSKQ